MLKTTSTAGSVANGADATFGNVTIGNVTVTGSITPNSAIGIVGTTTNNNVQAGSVGEFVSNTIVFNSLVSLSNGTAKTIATIPLTAGDWEVSAQITFTGGATTTVTDAAGGISTTANTLPVFSAGDTNRNDIVPLSASFATSTALIGCPVGPWRVSIAANTTVHMVAQLFFGVSTAAAYGTIRARRVR